MTSSSRLAPSSAPATQEAACRFCEILGSSDQVGTSRPVWDEHLLETKSFVVTPTKGSILPRWLLVSPKQHVPSISQIEPNERGELYDLLAYLQEQLTPTWGTMTILEHGALVERSLLGCGVDHAHLHMIALPTSCLDEIVDNDLFIKRSSSLQLPSLDMAVAPYWYAYNPIHGSHLAYPKTEESQFFRKLIATHLGIGDQYDYKRHAFAENASLTVSDFRATVLGAQHVG